MPNATTKAEPKRKRGRPRAYDPDVALAQATEVFWDSGFAAASLDDLGAAMAMNRPSLYGAFGDKESLYLKTLARYRDDGEARLKAALDPSRSLSEGLRAVYRRALAGYLAGDNGARGCFLIGTAATEAVLNPQVRALLATSLRVFDHQFQLRFKLARDAGEIDAASDPSTLARLASAILHSLALRARAGDSKSSLDALAESGLAMICAQCGAKEVAPRKQRGA